MINKKSLLLIVYLAITGCNIDCVEPGLQSRNTSVNVNVPVHKVDERVKINWIDSGQIISKDEKIKFTIDGSLNFCFPKEDKNPRKVLVPAVFCADGSIPIYNKAININDVSNNYGVDEKDVSGNELCGGRGFGSNRRYVDTEIKVNPGDKLNFSLVPREILIDYDNPEEKSISLNDNCYKTEKEDDKNRATIKEILNGGTFFCESNGKRTAIEFPNLNKKNIEKRKVLVGNGYTPYDNKVHFNKNFIKRDEPWINGALLDLQQARVGLNELCNGKNCNLNEIKKYGSYELNCYYQNICYTKEGIFNNDLHKKGNRNCVSSIRYEKYDKKNKENKKEYKCNMYSHLKKIEDRLKEIKENKSSTSFTSNDKEDIENILWAEALIAKIGNFDTTKNRRFDRKNGNTNSVQYLPKEKDTGKNSNQEYKYSKTSNDFEDFSLRLNYTYEINGDVSPGSDVMLAIVSDGNYSLHRGGYHVEVTRSCEYINGQKLYMYLGNKSPKDLSNVGINDFKKVEELYQRTENNVNYYIINGNHLTDKESEKIYFGIDVSNIEKEDITDEKGKYYENNKYIITLFVKKKNNDLISSNVNKIFNFIKKEVIGDSVEDLYKGYAKGFLQGVRALLTLYIIFTVVGYMLGMIQLSKFDFIIRIMKIAFIAFAFSDNSWKFFGTTLSKFFMDCSTHLVDSFSDYIGEGDKRFAFLDLTAGIFFTEETWLKFLSLIFAGPFGFIAFLIILHASFMFLKCIISATFRYVISTVLVAFLLSLTPLFIVFILFQQTKSLFNNWIKTLAHVSVQPMILFSSLSILNQLIYSILYNLTNFSACYQCLISINFLSYDFCLMKSILPLGYNPGINVDVALNDGSKTSGHFAALPIDLIQAIIYFIIAKAMEVFVSASETMTQAIFNAGFGIVGSVGDVANSASQAILSTVGFDDTTQGNKERGIEGMIPHVKRMTNQQDRTQIEYKLPKTLNQAEKEEKLGAEYKKEKKGTSDIME
ncbi:MAG: type IV secretion system protein [Wolbachia sp.]